MIKLWIQSAGNNSADLYFKDSSIVTDESEMLQIEKELERVEYIAQCLMMSKKRLRSELGSPTFTFAYVPNRGFVYKSIFNELAEDGRKAAFLVFFDKGSSNNIWEVLSQISSSLNRSLRDIEKPIVMKLIKRINKIKIASLSAVLLTLICLIIFE